jgi:hypothetical protein
VTVLTITVFQDSSILRHSGGIESDSATRHDHGEYMSAEAGLYPVGFGSNDIGFNDSNSTRVEDLGQFWLWNLEDFNY